MDEKPKVTVTSSEDPLDGKIIHAEVSDDEVFIRCQHCGHNKANKVAGWRGGPSATGAPSSMLQTVCQKCKRMQSIGY